MLKKCRFLTALILVMLLILSQAGNLLAAAPDTLAAAVDDTARYMLKTVKSPQVGSIGGEWAVLGLARSGYDVPEEYYQDYYAAAEECVRACKGILHEKKYTEYSRLIVALSSIGKDARDVAGYDLTRALGDYEKTIWQGLNGPIWALIALDSANYPMPVNPEAKTQATRQMYIDRILECRLSDGGWSLFGGTSAASSGDGGSDPDITGMALQALAKYQDQPAVAEAVKEALACMSEKQSAAGGFSSWGTANSESCVQIIVALTELGVSLEDERFIKDGKTLLDNLMTFYLPGQGFLHTADGSGSNQMASEQGFYGLVAARRAAQAKNSLYRMGDALKLGASSGGDATEKGLPGKNPDVKAPAIIQPGKTFADITGVNAHANQYAIEALAARGIMGGVTDDGFQPEKALTRAEFASLLTRALGLIKTGDIPFTDIGASAWYHDAAACAYGYGLIKGITADKYGPASAVTIQEAAAILVRAAGLCGLETKMEQGQIRDMLAQFVDYQSSSAWARGSLAYCYESGILDQNDLEIRPKAQLKRCEAAQMIYNLLSVARLL